MIIQLFQYHLINMNYQNWLQKREKFLLPPINIWVIWGKWNALCLIFFSYKMGIIIIELLWGFQKFINLKHLEKYQTLLFWLYLPNDNVTFWSKDRVYYIIVLESSKRKTENDRGGKERRRGTQRKLKRKEEKETEV